MMCLKLVSNMGFIRLKISLKKRLRPRDHFALYVRAQSSPRMRSTRHWPYGRLVEQSSEVIVGFGLFWTFHLQIPKKNRKSSHSFGCEYNYGNFWVRFQCWQYTTTNYLLLVCFKMNPIFVCSFLVSYV